MNFYSPMFFMFLLGLIPIILMYLLKKQHEEIKISSTYLWERAIKDIEANKPWQKLRKNLLLFLQMLIFTLIVFSLAQPYFLSNSVNAENLIIVLDRSASMQSTDVKDSRFEAAKSEIMDIFDNLNPVTNVTLITMGNNPEIVVSSTKDKDILKKGLKEIEVSNHTDDIDKTISLLQSLTKGLSNYKILFYTDKGVNEQIDNMIVKNISENYINLAIDNISHSKANNGLVVLTTVTNYCETELGGDLTLYTDNEIYDVIDITIKPNESQNFYWNGVPENVNILKVEIDVKDSLKVDNVRYHVVNSSQTNKVLLVTKGNIFLEKSLLLNPNIELYKTNEALKDIKGYDLYIFDGLLPEELPIDGNIVVFNPPDDNQVIKVMDKGSIEELNLHQDQLFNYVNLDFYISEVKFLQTPKWAVPVLESNNKSILYRGLYKNQKFVVAGFDIHNTDFPLKIGFPIFIQNILEYTLHFNEQLQLSVLSGEYIDINIPPKATEVTIINPKGERVKLAPPFPLAPFNDTNDIGVYTIEQMVEEQKYENYFASNIDTTNESDIDFKYDAVDGSSNEINNNREMSRDLQNIFIWAALILLILEWMVYNRGY